MTPPFKAAELQSHKTPCITLVGMPGAGKSTVGQALAKHLHWAFVDSDFLIEATYGTALQNVTDVMSKDAFLDVESTLICSLFLFRAVLATGGSVIYREAAMRHLHSLGPVVHLQVSLPLLEERIARKPDRGLAIAPGQTIADLFAEREALYHKYAQCAVDAEHLDPEECAKAIIHVLQSQHLMP